METIISSIAAVLTTMSEGAFDSGISADQLDYVQIDDGLIDQAIQALNAVRRERFKLAVAESLRAVLLRQF